MLSDAEVPIEVISQLVGPVTEIVYRKQVRPVIQAGALVIDARFDQRDTVVTH